MRIRFSRQSGTGDPVKTAPDDRPSSGGRPSLADLLSCVAAMWGPATGHGAPDAAATPERERPPAALYRFDCWTFDSLTGQLTDPAGIAVPLSERERALLLSFLAAPGQLLMRDQLAKGLLRHGADDPSIELEILGLRRKLETDPRFPEIIVTDRDEQGVGYVFALDVEGP